jgi:hypothetical protein
MMLPLVLLALAPTEPLVHEVQAADGIEATLSVTVPPRPDLRSPPRIRVELRITGPATLQVEPAKLSDEVRAWKVTRASSWTPEGDRLLVAQSLLLEQARSGQQPVPGLRVRARAGAETTTQQFEWPDLFGGPPTPPVPTIVVPTPPVTNWPLAVALSGTMIAGFLALLTWRLTRRPPAPHVVTPEETARLTLTGLTKETAWADARAAATRLSETLRTYLMARTGLDLLSRTAQECLVLLRAGPVVVPETLPTLEAILTWCDATRFAGPAADASAGPAQAAEALALLPRLLHSSEQ